MALGFGENVAKLSATLTLDSDGFVRGMGEASTKLDAYNAKLKEQGVSNRLATMASRDYAKQLYDEAKAVDNSHKSHTHLLADMENMKTKLRDFNGVGPFGMSTLTKGIAKATAIGIDFGQMIEKGAVSLGNWVEDITKGIPIVENLGIGVSGVIASFGEMLAVLGPVGAALAAVAAAFGLVYAAVQALAALAGTVIAFFADLVAPVSLLVALLGGLGAAFVIGGKRAAEGGGKLNAFGNIVSTLGSMFGKTSNILAHVFLPYLVELGHAAERALNFLDKVVKLPLGQAFKMLDTQGTQLLGKFVDRVSQVLSKPIRLAFKVAFGDSHFSNMVSDWWHRFTAFLFGETKRHPVEIAPHTFVMKKTTVDGALQPFIDWFNRHNFSKQGHKIGKQIGDAIFSGIESAAKRSAVALFHALNQPLGPKLLPLVRRAGSYIESQIGHAASVSKSKLTAALGAAWAWISSKAAAVWNAIMGKISGVASHGKSAVQNAFGAAWGWVSNKAGGVWNAILSKITGVAGRAKSAITGALGSAWNAVKSQADNLWNHIKSLFSETLSIHVSLPHIPGGSLRDILGIAGGGIVPHIPGSQLGKDSVPAMLTPGEMVLNRSQQEALGGSAFLKEALGFANGGIVPPPRRKKENKSHYQSRIHNWFTNSTDKKFNALDFQLQLLDRKAQRDDSEGNIASEIKRLQGEQGIRSQEIRLLKSAAAFARRHGWISAATDYGRQAAFIRQDQLDMTDTIKGLRSQGSPGGLTPDQIASQVASMLAAFQSFAAQYGSNILFNPGSFISIPGAGGSGGGSTGGGSGGGTLPGRTVGGGNKQPRPHVTIHQHMVQHDDQFVHLRRAQFAAQAAFAS